MVAHTVRFFALAIIATVLGLASGSLAFGGTDHQGKDRVNSLHDVSNIKVSD